MSKQVQELSPPRAASLSDVSQVFGPPPDELAPRRLRLVEDSAPAPGRPEPAAEVRRAPVYSAPPRVRNVQSGSWTGPPPTTLPPTTLPPMASFDPIEPGESSEFTLDGGELWLHVRDARHKLIGGMTATDISARLSDGRLGGREMVSLDRVNWIAIRYLDRLSVVLAGGPAAADAVDRAPPPRVAPPLGLEEEIWDRGVAPPPLYLAEEGEDPDDAEPTLIDDRWGFGWPATPVVDPGPAAAVVDPGRAAPAADPGTLDIRPPTRRSWAPVLVLGLVVVGAAIGWMIDRRLADATVWVAPSVASAPARAAHAPAAPPPGYISVTAREPLLVIVDGESTGEYTPLWKHAVPSGERVVELRAADGRTVHRRVADVPPEQTIPVPFQR